MQKPCRHLASISLGKLSEKLALSSPIQPNFCISCSKETESVVYSCLTCLQSFCQSSPSHLNHHARERNHPLSFNLTAADAENHESIEKYFYCSLCSDHPKICEPGRKERVYLEKVKGFFKENQKNGRQEVVHEDLVAAGDDKIVKPRGISNLGNTCFMNSALQLLAVTLKRHGPLKITSTSPIWSSLIYHLEEIYSSTSSEIIKRKGSKKKQTSTSCRNSLNPREFLSLLCGKQRKFASMQQQDAHDFLRLLFNSVPEAPQIELFGGKFISRVVCERCKKVSDTIEPFLDISLALPEETTDETFVTKSLSRLQINTDSSSSNSNSSSTSNSDSDTDGSNNHSNSDSDGSNNQNQNTSNYMSIDLLLKNWNKKISLKGENGYYCESCSPQDTKILQSASLQYFLTDPLPPFLILHLQRFKTVISTRKSKIGVTIEKDDRNLSFPFNLKISSQLCSKEATNYNLYGYIIHEGSSTSCGHYTAIVSSSNDCWFYISDTNVKEISKSRALDTESFTPYLLFYQKEKEKNY
jgi:ubiquitin C-terminal hydrolase